MSRPSAIQQPSPIFLTVALALAVLLAAASPIRAQEFAPLLDTAASITVTSPEPLRSTPAPELGSRISRLYPEKDVKIETDVASALERATSRLGSSSLVCATGSTYIAGAARRLLLSSIGLKASFKAPDLASTR